MNFLNSLLIGLAEWSQGPWTAGQGGWGRMGAAGPGCWTEDAQEGCRWELQAQMAIGEPGQMGNAFCPRKLIWRPFQVMG